MAKSQLHKSKEAKKAKQDKKAVAMSGGSSTPMPNKSSMQKSKMGDK